MSRWVKLVLPQH